MSEVVSVSEMFGKDVFNDAVMKDRLPKSVYKKLKKTIEDGAELDPSIADFIGESNIVPGLMIHDELVEIFGARFACVDKGFGNNKPVDVNPS